MMLRAGLIGLGSMGRHHARLLRSSDQVAFVGAVDPGGDRHGALVDTPILPSIEALVDEGIDIAVLAVPTIAHEPAAMLLAASGVHTLIEKPLAESVTAAQRIRDEFAASSITGVVGHVERFNPALIELRRRLRHGELGRVFSIATERVGPFPNRIQDVGVVKDLATHDIDIITWLAGEPIDTLSAQVTHKMGRDHEDLVVAHGRLGDQTIFSLVVNWLTPTKKRSVTVLGERGAFVADLLGADLFFFANSEVPTQWDALARLTGVAEGDMIRYSIPKPEPLRSELDAFCALVGGSSDTEIASLDQGVEILKTAEAIVESAASNTVRSLR